MRILVTGGSGLIGGRLVPALVADGHTVSRLVRARPRAAREFRWSPESGLLDPASLAGCEAVIHLAGASLAAGSWDDERRAEILGSRVAGTRLLAAAMARATPPPATLVCASAVGIYGDRGEEVLSEASGPGAGFLAEVVRAWEAEAAIAAQAGVRVLHLRFGMVLARHAGALPRLVLPFRFGLGGHLGSGRQWLSWITLDDVVGVVRHVLARGDLAGPVNVVSPGPVTSRDLARALGGVLGRPVWMPIPAWALRFALGQMGEELLLFSQRAVPARLRASGFAFAHGAIEGALRHVLRGRLDDGGSPA